jgi:hypothetical protein
MIYSIFCIYLYAASVLCQEKNDILRVLSFFLELFEIKARMKAGSQIEMNRDE